MWRRANSVRGIEYSGLLEVFLTVYTAWSIGIRGPELDTEEGKFVVAFLSRGALGPHPFCPSTLRSLHPGHRIEIAMRGARLR